MSKNSFRVLVGAAAAGALVAASAGTAEASVAPTPISCAQPDGRVSAIAFSGTTAYIGGRFTRVKDKAGRLNTRGHLAAIDTASCDLLPWRADTDGEVMALTAAGNSLYAGGDFRTVAGSARSNLAAFSLADGTLTGFSPAVNNSVLALGSFGNLLYVGGSFAKVGTATRQKAAAFALDTGTLDDGWKPSANGKVQSIATSAAITTGTSTAPARVYLGGAFTTLSGRTDVDYLAAVDPASGTVDGSFKTGVTYPILDVVADSAGVYGGGAGHGGHLDIWDLSGTLKQPEYQTDGDVQAVAVDGDSVYAGGHFTNYCDGNTGNGAPFQCDVNVERRKLFEVSVSRGSLTQWKPALNSPFGALSAAVDANHRLWVGGDFTSVDGKSVGHLAVFP